MSKKLISIATTAYNEEDSLEQLISDLNKHVISQLETYQFEMIICDNGSTYFSK